MWCLRRVTKGNIEKAISFVKVHEITCVNLAQELKVLQKSFTLKENSATEMFQGKKNKKEGKAFLLLHNTEVVAVFAIDRQKTLLHCFPQLDRVNVKAFFGCVERFFFHNKIASIMGEKKATLLLQMYLTEEFNYSVKKEIPYYLLTKKAGSLEHNGTEPHFENQGLNDKGLVSNSQNHLIFEKCTTKDIDGLIPLQLGYEREELERERQNEMLSRLYLQRMISEQEVFQCKIGGKVVSKAHTNAQGFLCKQIGGVFTVSEHRGKHFANQLLQFVLNSLKSSTETFVLFVKAKNENAIKLYTRLGFDIIDKFSIVHFETD